MISLPIYAGMLCNQVGLVLTMGGDVAWSAGGHINLPALPLNDPTVIDLSCGMIMHEGGHESHTNFQVWDTIKHDQVLATMVNRLEDIRIERKQIEGFAGGKARLQQMTRQLVSRGYWTPATDQDSPATLLGKTILYQLRSKFLSQDVFDAMGEEAFKRLDSVLPKNLAGHLMTIAEQVIWCQNTNQVVDLAANILKILKEEQENQEQPNADPQEQSPSGNQANQGQNQSNGQQHGQQASDPASGSQQGNDPDGNQGSQNGEEQSGTGTGSQTTSGPGGGAGEQDPQKLAEAISSILKGENDAAPGDVGKAVSEALSSISQGSDNAIAMPVATKSALEAGDATQILAKIQNASRALQTRTQRQFEAQVQKKRRFREEGRRVDVNRLWRPPTGDYRVFVEKTETNRVDTAVELLVDVSNSMNTHERLEPAVNVALALAKSLSKLNGVKVATACFPAVGSADAKESERVSVIHGFNERPEATAKKFAAMYSTAYTPTAEALLWAGGQLVARKESRKIVFVLTDGIPEMPGRSTYKYRELTVEVRKSLEASGIEVYGLGIQIDVKDIFPASIQVNSLDELANSVFSLMNNVLLKAA